MSPGAKLLILISILCGEKCFQAEANANFPSSSEWISALVRNGYDRRRTPTYNRAQPTMVKISLYIESLGNFQAKTMDYDVDLYFHEFWQDERLAHPNVDLPDFTDDWAINEIWRPDVYFLNAKEAKPNMMTTPNIFLHISDNGAIFYSLRVHLKLICDMQFQDYPFDHQTCSIRMVSYGLTADKTNVTWGRPAWLRSEDFVTVNPRNAYSDLQLARVEQVECDGTYPTGVYSCIEAKFHLVRHVTFYVLQDYVPTGLIVCVSWISFWIDPTSVPARVSLSVTSLLTLATQTAAIVQKLPPVTYTKAIDIWLCTCLIFVFGALIEYACIDMLKKSEKNLEEKKLPPSSGMTGKEKTPSIAEADGLKSNEKKATNVEVEELLQKDEASPTASDESEKKNSGDQKLDGNAKATRLEIGSRIGFPASFIAFNLIYWLYYWN